MEGKKPEHTHVGSTFKRLPSLAFSRIEEGPKMVARSLALLATIFGSSLLITVGLSSF